MSEVTAEQDILRIINLDVALSAIHSTAIQQALAQCLGRSLDWQRADASNLVDFAPGGSGQIGPLVLIYPSLTTALNRAQHDVLAAERAIVGWQEVVEAILRFYRKRRTVTFLLASDAVFDNPDELRQRLVQWVKCRTAEVGEAEFVAGKVGLATMQDPEPVIGRVMAAYLQLSCHPLRKLSEELAGGGMALLLDAGMAVQTTTQALQSLAAQNSNNAAKAVLLQATLAQNQQDHLADLRAASETAMMAMQAEKAILEHKIASQQAQLVAMQVLIEQDFIARHQQKITVSAIDPAQKSELEQKNREQEALLRLERSKVEEALSEQRRMLAELSKQGAQEASRISDLQTELRHQTALLQDRDGKLADLIARIREQAEVIAETEIAMQTEEGLRRQKETEVVALLCSTSWKVTKPLRALRSIGKIKR
jgi:hypothetical protein